MSQSGFARALLDPDAPLPPGLIRPDGTPATRRFDVYRNNVTLSLRRALEAGFPAVRKLVGEDFFAAMAREFLRAHPPKSPVLMLYGAGFPEFLQGFAPVAHLAYLPDVARLEQAIRESYHAGDAAPLPSEDLTSLPEAELLSSRFALAPALRLVCSPWPVHAIWRANLAAGPAPQARAEDVAVVRPLFDPEPRLLPRGGGAVLASLMAGETLQKALAAAPQDFDLPAFFALLFAGHCLTGVSR